MNYEQFKTNVLGKTLGDGQCVALIDGNDAAYVEQLFPGVTWTDVLHSVGGARELAGINNSYVHWIANDRNDPNQLPQQGDIMVFDATPAAGYSNTYNNPYGHVGVCDSADSKGYNLLQQNAPSNGAPVGVTRYDWKFRPCTGWLRPQTTSPAAAGGTTKRIYFVGEQTATFYQTGGGTFAMHCNDGESWIVLEDQGYRVRVNSASAGMCWVYIIWQNGSQKGQAIQGRYVK